MKFRHREIFPVIQATTRDTINFSGNDNPRIDDRFTIVTHIWKRTSPDADWNRMEAKWNEGGDSAAVAAIPDAIARKIRHAEKFPIRASLYRETVSFEAK